tara:strand:+ start:2444 stop:2962 length:519 start_codon:yes stop_codon:yes gene_type:complete
MNPLRMIELLKELLPDEVLARLLTKDGALKNIPMHHGTSETFEEFAPDVPVWLAEDPTVGYRASTSGRSVNMPSPDTKRGPPRIITTLPDPRSALTSSFDGSTDHLNSILDKARRDDNDYIDIPRARDIFIDNNPHYGISLNPENLIRLEDRVIPMEINTPRKFNQWFRDTE